MEKLYEYLARTNFWQFYVNMCINFSQKMISDKLRKLENTRIKFDPDEYSEFQKGAQKNPLLNLFHSFFNIKLLIKNHKQPEDYGLDKVDIDRISLKTLKLKLPQRLPDNRRQRINQRFSSILDATMVNNLQVPGLVQNGRKTIDTLRTIIQIDSTTENFTNPLAGLLANFQKMGINLEKIEKNGYQLNHDGTNQGHSLEFIEDEMLANIALGNINQRKGILEQTISHLIFTGRFTFSTRPKKTDRRHHKSSIGKSSLENSSEVSQPEGIDESEDKALKPCKETSGIKKMKKIVRAIMLAKRLNVVAVRASNLKQQKTKSNVVYNQFTIQMYSEKIKTITLDMAQ